MRPPPPGADPQLWYWFQIVDTDASGYLTVDELQRALINGDWTPFNIETVRMMVVMFDTDNTGTIDFNEFTGLWRYIEDWQRCFRTFDTDGSGNIDARELRHALQTFGYNLSEPFVNVLIQKFDRYGMWEGKDVGVCCAESHTHAHMFTSTCAKIRFSHGNMITNRTWKYHF